MFQLWIFKIKVGLTAAFAVVTTFVCGQSYIITPNDTLMDTTPFNNLTHFNIQQLNLTSTPLVFSWQQIGLSIPAGWDANLCDNGNCYAGFPVSGTMDTVFNGDYGLMSVGINPYTISGTAIIQYTIWEENTPQQIDTLTWIISADVNSGIKNNTSEIPKIWLNQNIIHIQNISGQFSTLQLVDLSGNLVFTTNINSKNQIDLPEIQPSIYIVQLSGNQDLYKQKIYYHK